jgi:ABC-2 type transport system ATP-binding protein
LDLLKADKSEIFFWNKKVENEEWKKDVGAFLDKMFLVEFLKPKEYFQLIADFRGWDKDQLNNFCIKHKEFFDVTVTSNDKILRKLSSGNKKKVGILGSFVGNPKVIILDEPWVNLDPSSCVILGKYLKNLQAMGTTILASSHHIHYALELADRLVLMESGVIIMDERSATKHIQEIHDYFRGKANLISE